MKINELVVQPELDEVRMDPTSFAQAVDQGHEAGVLVGFEFEVHVPEATLTSNKPSEDDTESKLKEFLSVITQYFDNHDLDDLLPETFDQNFEFRQAINGFVDIQSAINAMTQERLAIIRKLFDQIPEKLRAKILKKSSRDYPQNTIPADMGMAKQLSFFRSFGNRLYYGGGNDKNIETLGREIMRASNHDWEEVLSFLYAGRVVKWDDIDSTATQISHNFLNYFNLKRPVSEIWNDLDLDDWIDSDYDDYDDNPAEYKQATAILSPALESMTGRQVHVFNRYHEQKKNTTDWYIEPDGSLEANNPNDVSCEIVSPPLLALEAMDSLNKFYGLASKLHLYTNNTTGLHINVSIPKDLDVLKLAVFLGDQYVLKYFNRDNNHYAASVLKSLEKVADQGLTTTVKNKQKDVFGKPVQISTLDTKLLNKLAGSVSSAHTASISYNGKYISFRHAGGDYLNDLQGIKNAVGRFVRAMIIASDPSAYVNEYKTKLVKLTQQETAGKSSPNASALINHLRTKGSPTLTISIASFSDHTTLDKLLNKIITNLELKGKVTIKAIETGNAVKQNFINRAKKPETKEKLDQLPENVFVTYSVVPTTANSLIKVNNSRTTNNVQSINNGRFDTVGFTMIHSAILEPSNPQVQHLVKQLLKSIYKK